MRILIIALTMLSFSAIAQKGTKAETSSKAMKAEMVKPTQTQTVEASCGQCQFGLKGGGCDLAVRMPDGKAYYVDGTSMGDHGDAHAKDGMCMKVRTAEVQGEVKNNRFVASNFKLLPATAPNTQAK